MAFSTFKGPIRSGTIKDTTGTTVGKDIANLGYVTLTQAGTVTFGADGSTTVTAYLPANSQIIEIYSDVLTAFDAATTNTISIGDGTTADKYAATLDVSSVGRVLASSDASQLGNLKDIGTSDVALTVTYNQTGTAATAGEALVTVVYAQGNDLA